MSAVLEALVVHGLAALHWVDGTTGDVGPNPRAPLGVGERVPVTFASLPRGLRVIQRSVGLAFSFEDAVVVAGAAQAADLQPPARGPVLVEGVAGGSDAGGNPSAFIPRRFSLNLVRGGRNTLTLYRSVAGTRSSSGALFASCRTPAGEPVPWALLTLSVTVPPGGVRTFRAQADAHGDVLLAPQRLPPLPAGVADYAATLAVQAGPALGAEMSAEPVDPDNLPPARLRPLNAAGAAQASVPLAIAPGVARRLESAGQSALIIEP